MSKGTILVTGATGFIAKHIVATLLNAGYRVRGSVRSPARHDEIVAAVTPVLRDASNLSERFETVPLDLLKDEGWDTAMAGVDGVMHTASPFPIIQPRDESELVRPAVDGTLRALRAARAAGVGRVVLTSSTVAISNRRLPEGRSVYDESDWTDTEDPRTNPYAKSKTLAERAAWEFVEREAPDMSLRVVNPALVLGPALDDKIGTSIKVVQRLLAGRDPMVPRIGFSVVDVRDIAEMHLRAFERDAAHGQRFIGAERFMWFQDIARVLKAAYPDRRIPTRQAPDFLVRALALFDPSVRSVVPILGRREEFSNARAREVLGIDFIPGPDAALAAAESVLAHQ